MSKNIDIKVIRPCEDTCIIHYYYERINIYSKILSKIDKNEYTFWNGRNLFSEIFKYWHICNDFVVNEYPKIKNNGLNFVLIRFKNKCITRCEKDKATIPYLLNLLICYAAEIS